MMHLMKNKKGFTLVEIIIAIGLIAIFSSVILQLFVTSRTLHQKARDLDKSIILATNIVETFKSGTKASDIKTNKLLEYSAMAEDGKEITIYMHYDENWNLIKDGSSTPQFIVKTVIKPAAETGNIYDIDVNISRATPYPMDAKPKKEIYDIRSTRYFSESQ